MAKNMQSVDNNDSELDLNVKDFDSTSLHPVKMNKQFTEELVSVLKDQFSSLKTSFVDLQTSVNPIWSGGGGGIFAPPLDFSLY